VCHPCANLRGASRVDEAYTRSWCSIGRRGTRRRSLQANGLRTKRRLEPNPSIETPHARHGTVDPSAGALDPRAYCFGKVLELLDV
jgi:hypothetical protein